MIELRNVAVTYPGDVVGLRPTSLTFDRRQFTVLLGLSGAGKSTLLRSLNLLARPTQGTIEVDGIGSLTTRRALIAHRRRTAIIFQQHQLIGRYSALHNVLMARIGRHPAWRTAFPLPASDRLIALDCLDRVGLLEKALSRADSLSGGQQQRVGIARALAQQPDLILADEPVASLDPSTSHKVLSQLHDICRQDGLPAIVSLHQLDLARAFADRVIGLCGGSVVFDGPPDCLTDRAVARIYERRLPGTSERSDASGADHDLNTELEAIG